MSRRATHSICTGFMPSSAHREHRTFLPAQSWTHSSPTHDVQLTGQLRAGLLPTGENHSPRERRTLPAWARVTFLAEPRG